MTMDFIKWKAEYSVNVEVIDDQHKKLIGLINQMADAMSIGRGRDVLGTVLTELVDYTVYHFKTEERLFQQYGYPEYKKHKKIHAALTAKTRELKESFDGGNRQLSVDVMLFLSNWLNNHILEVDKKYGPFLNSKGVH
jgi:hemerythrin